MPVMPEPVEFISVAVPTPLRSTFQYRPGNFTNIKVGARVLVPFGNRKLFGIVTSIDSQARVDVAKIRPLLDVFHPDANVTKPIVQLCQWAADYYQHPVGEVFASALPGLVRKGWNPRESEDLLRMSKEGGQVDIDSLNRSPAQKKLLLAIRGSPLDRSRLTELAITSQTIRTLLNKNWVCWEKQETEPGHRFQLDRVKANGISLTAEQASVIIQINQSATEDSKTFLIQGVTGSGKTEIYLGVIEPLLLAGKQVLVLVPEIGLTPQTVARFRDRFDVPVAVIHSSLSDKERAIGWIDARDGNAGIILGTRSAIFMPMKSPGAIIVDEEHDASYKQHDGFRYSARDLAVLRGQFEKIPVILGSATPSLESLHNIETGKYVHLQLKNRPPGASAETYELIDTRHLELRDGFTRQLRKRIKEHLERGEQVLVFINRRGFAPVMLCNDCSWIAHCRSCDAKLTYHLNLNTLVCHHCGKMNHNIISCQSCSSNNLSAIGLGTQRVEQTLQKMFPDYPVLRIDRDTTRKKGAMEDFVAQINNREPAILVGTQLLAKGHHFPNVTLVAILDTDAGFYSSDFRAMERLGQIILQVGGRSGRADKSGSVLIQTAFATHPLLETLVNAGYAEFANALLAERREMQLPPYTFNALMRAEANDASTAREFLEQIVKRDKPEQSIELLGPIPALMEKRAGRYRQLLIISSNRRASIHRELTKRIEIAESLPEAKKVRWAIDVDPIDLF